MVSVVIVKFVIYRYYIVAVCVIIVISLLTCVLLFTTAVASDTVVHVCVLMCFLFVAVFFLFLPYYSE